MLRKHCILLIHNILSLRLGDGAHTANGSRKMREGMSGGERNAIMFFENR